MRLGQYVQWKSLAPGSAKVFAGFVRCYEAALNGWAVVEDEITGRWNPISRSRLIPVVWGKGKTAKGGGDSPAGSAAVLAEAA